MDIKDFLNRFNKVKSPQIIIALVLLLWPYYVFFLACESPHNFIIPLGDPLRLLCENTSITEHFVLKTVAAFLIILLFGVVLFFCYKNKISVLISNWTFFSSFCLSLILVFLCFESINAEISLLGITLFSSLSFYLLIYALFRKIGVILNALFIFVMLIKHAIVSFLGYAFNSELVGFILDANNDEILNFINATNILLVVFGIIVSILFSYLLYKSIEKEHRLTLVTSSFIYFVASYISAISFIGFQTIDMYGPYGALYNIQEVSLQAQANRDRVNKIITSLPSPAEKKSSISSIQPDNNLVVIFHIGESVRQDHMGFASYYRQTTPWLSSQKNLIHFDNCLSLAPSTKYAICVMLSDARRCISKTNIDPKMMPTCSSFIDLYAENYFDCYAFFHVSLRSSDVYFKNVIDKLTDKCIKSYYYNINQRLQYNQISELIRNSSQKNLFLLVNNEGSHLPFDGYDEQSTLFTPCERGAFMSRPDKYPDKARSAINAYDNTIVLLDQCIEKTIQSLGNRPYIYVYISDHGEQLGDNGVWERVTDEKYFETNAAVVPFFILASPDIENLHPHFAKVFKNLRNNQKMRVSQEHVFHTMLGIVGISSPYYKPELDLCTEHPIPYSGPYPEEKKD